MTLRPPEDLKGFTPFYDGTAVHFACPHCHVYAKSARFDWLHTSYGMCFHFEAFKALERCVCFERTVFKWLLLNGCTIPSRKPCEFGRLHQALFGHGTFDFVVV